MGWWKADTVDPVEAPPPSTKYTAPQNPTLPPSHPQVTSSTQDESCPVDQKTREIWLQQAKAMRQQQQQQQQQQPQSQPEPLSQPPSKVLPQPTFTSTTASQSQDCSSDRISQSASQDSVTVPFGRTTRTLSNDREVSSIPRAHLGLVSSTPSNSEQETGQSKDGKWIYPSETQFFNAVMRKAATNTSAKDLASSISSIIPIHNAVNERAWHLIKQWEGDSSKSCGGPKLLSFQGLGAGALSPRAKWNTMMGAKEPFDRHDWVVERCGGQQVEYIIDFYQGKEREDVDPKRRAQELNFYLDVRPKLTSFEGVKMRTERLLGLR